jgi:hypothetical protein
MRKITVLSMITLDEVMQAPGGISKDRECWSLTRNKSDSYWMRKIKVGILNRLLLNKYFNP